MERKISYIHAYIKFFPQLYAM